MLNLPKKRLSYSQVNLWNKNKEQYRTRYYRNEPLPENAEMIFGKTIAKRLEDNDPELAFIPRYDKAEHGIEVEIDGVMVQGYIDSFDPVKKKFREYKTGHLNLKGFPPWDIVAVHKHEQLPFYSLLIEETEGTVDPICHLDWIETEFKNKTIEFDGLTLETQSRDLFLTGRIETFERKIEPWERKRIREMIVRVAHEISADYTTFQNTSAFGKQFGLQNQ